MTKYYYVPQQNGVEGLEDFGDVHHGTNYEDVGRVFVGGVQLMGSVSEPTLVAEFLAKKGIRPTARVEQVYCSPMAPDTIATDVDRKRGWRYEVIIGLPYEMLGPTKVARGALAFVPGWDRNRQPRVDPDHISEDGEEGTHFPSAKPWLKERTFTRGSYNE